MASVCCRSRGGSGEQVIDGRLLPSRSSGCCSAVSRTSSAAVPPTSRRVKPRRGGGIFSYPSSAPARAGPAVTSLAPAAGRPNLRRGRGAPAPGTGRAPVQQWRSLPICCRRSEAGVRGVAALRRLRPRDLHPGRGRRGLAPPLAPAGFAATGPTSTCAIH